MKIDQYSVNFVREPLKSPFGFKGNYVNELWNTAVSLYADGLNAVGLGVQSPLWADADIFSQHVPLGSNALMFAITEYAAKLTLDKEITDPFSLFSEIYPEVLAYGKRIADKEDIRETFVLNAMVPVDMAVWLLWAKYKGIDSFDFLIPDTAKPYLAMRHARLGAIPLLTYGVDTPGIRAEANQGSYILKIKIGSDPEHDGDREKMLAWDKSRLSQIHNALKEIQTPYTDTGKVAYYLDANGRYDTLDRVSSLLDHADKIGALDQIVLLEEPFPESSQISVHTLPVRVAADESVHSDADVRQRAELGYTAVALKPIAKTMSMTFAMIKTAGERNIPCFCADLTVNPFMVDINKNFAARLAPIPGMKVGVLESNGYQNYVNWDKMCKTHPLYPAKWIGSNEGSFLLGSDFWKQSGGIFAKLDGFGV